VNVTEAAALPPLPPAMLVSVSAESTVVPNVAAKLAGVQALACWAFRRLTKAW
jgi:hypothetical protein